MYIVTVFNQIITGEWITAQTGKMDKDIADGVYDRLSIALYKQLQRDEILDYKVTINAE